MTWSIIWWGRRMMMSIHSGVRVIYGIPIVVWIRVVKAALAIMRAIDNHCHWLALIATNWCSTRIALWLSSNIVAS